MVWLFCLSTFLWTGLQVLWPKTDRSDRSILVVIQWYTFLVKNKRWRLVDWGGGRMEGREREREREMGRIWRYKQTATSPPITIRSLWHDLQSWTAQVHRDLELCFPRCAVKQSSPSLYVQSYTLPSARAGHFRYFLIFSLIKNDFFAFLSS